MMRRTASQLLALRTASPVLGAIVLAAFVACADSEPAADLPKDTPEGGTLPPRPDADVVDASSDDADSGDAEAGTPECSKEGFCHTTVPPDQTLRGVWSDGAGLAWAISEQGSILRYDGTAWTVYTSGLGQLFSIWGSGPTDIWVGGDGPVFHGQGASSASLVFTRMETPGEKNPITSIWGTGANDVWAIGGANAAPLQGRLLHFTGEPGKDGAGAEWSLEPAYTAGPIWLLRVFGSAASGVWIAGTIDVRDDRFLRRRAVVLRRSVGSTEFLNVDLPRDPDFIDSTTGYMDRLFDASASSDGLSMWVLGKTEGSVPAALRATSDDGGQTFTWTFAKMGTYNDPALHAVGAVDANDAYVVGDYSRLRHWNGAKWKQSVITVTKFPLTIPLYALGGQGQDLWFVGEGIALHRDPSKVQP